MVRGCELDIKYIKYFGFSSKGLLKVVIFSLRQVLKAKTKNLVASLAQLDRATAF